jgi:hypothetical protein
MVPIAILRRRSDLLNNPLRYDLVWDGLHHIQKWSAFKWAEFSISRREHTRLGKSANVF